MGNKSVFRLALLFSLAVAFSFCSSPGGQANQKVLDAESAVEVSVLNPNGDSELALLMRKLFEDADSLRSKIKDGTGNISEDYILAIQKSHTATPTDHDVQDEQFHAMNKMLLSQANDLMGAKDNHVEKFNAMVGRCIDCHNTVCPGPITRIEKLYIK